MDSARIAISKPVRKPTETGERKLLSHRVQFVSTRQYVEDNFGQVLDAFSSGDLDSAKFALLWFADHLIFYAGSAFQTATAKAVDEAVSLMRDPDYYETVRSRRQRDRARAKADAEERWQKRHNPDPPTLQEVQRDLKQVAQSIVYHESNITVLAVRGDELRKREAALLLQETEAEDGVM